MTGPLALHVPSGVEHVFVYGTLRRGGANDITRLQPPPVFIGMARLRGRMYGFGGYPGVVLDDTADWVEGEVYRFAPDLEPVLDGIEELYPEQRDEYLKRVVDVEVGRQRLRCLVYELNPRYAEGREPLSPGDWLLHASHCA
ncbi:gamma-glutamylcyclotransferase family protein [Caldimonas aquatica]|uniref:Gamma-glutamylcyclotransferase n=1 Tax=Caldimonas aquatica TaxID=376175 RepID=A0ABY6MWF3_9BURK|nr:gamma-glutamylcyclotransferase family protein [Schlegelella aquatica]UZD56329.1 gamma-glutamylcyclotransferase [Schlegelella aquatica]